MSKWIDADAIDKAFSKLRFNNDGELEHYGDRPNWYLLGSEVEALIADAPSIDIVRCQDCKKSHTDGKTTHYLWCVEWGRSTDTFGYCERGEREGE